MLSFQRLFSVFAVLASLVLLSTARPTHRDLATIRARADADSMVVQMQSFEKDLKVASEKLVKATASGDKPLGHLKVQLKDISDVFSKYSQPTVTLGVTKLTSEQETTLTNSVVDSIKLACDAAYKTKDMKMYPEWTNMDAAMYGYYMHLAPISFAAFKASLAKAGSVCAREFHELHMRNMVNLLGGSGYGY